MTNITVFGGQMSEEEQQSYLKHLQEKYPHYEITNMTLTIMKEGEDEFIDIRYEYNVISQPFERIRRINGYLVGTLDKFNDAKRSEVDDRVKHG